MAHTQASLARKRSGHSRSVLRLARPMPDAASLVAPARHGMVWLATCAAVLAPRTASHVKASIAVANMARQLLHKFASRSRVLQSCIHRTSMKIGTRLRRDRHSKPRRRAYGRTATLVILESVAPSVAANSRATTAPMSRENSSYRALALSLSSTPTSLGRRVEEKWLSVSERLKGLVLCM